MNIKKLSFEIISIIFTKIRYEDINNFAITNKKIYNVFENLKKNDVKINIKNFYNFKKYLCKGFRYLNILQYNIKIINIIFPTINIFNIICYNGDIITVNKIKNTIYLKRKYNNKKEYIFNINCYLIINSKFNIKCKIIDGINQNFNKIMLV